MKFLRRKAEHEPSTATERLQTDEREQPEELLPLEFVASHKGALQASAMYWNEVSSVVEEIQGDTAQEIARESIRNLATSRNEHMPENRERSISAQAITDLASVTFLAARATSPGPLIHSSMNMVKTITDDLPTELTYIAMQKDGLMETCVHAASTMRLAINEADRKANSILADLASELVSSPNSISALDDLYSDGADLVNPDFLELREVIRTDWHAKGVETSRLRAMMASIKTDPNAFLEEFIDNIVGTEGDKKMATIQDMARFALVDSATPESPEALRAVLLRNRNSWHTFEDIENLLATYQSQKLTVLNLAMDRIAGPVTADNPRLSVSPEELTEFKQRIRFDVSENRQKRRKSNGGSRSSIRPPRIKKVVAVNERYDRTNKPLYFTKNTATSTLTKETVDKDNSLASHVASRVKEHLVSDIIVCIQAINENPLDHSSRMILSSKGRVIIDGKKARLRRYKSNNAQGGPNISREAASYRICYAIIDGSVVITDILTHDQFEAKFK